MITLSEVIRLRVFRTEVNYSNKEKPDTVYVCAPTARAAKKFLRGVIMATYEQKGGPYPHFKVRCMDPEIRILAYANALKTLIPSDDENSY